MKTPPSSIIPSTKNEKNTKAFITLTHITPEKADLIGILFRQLPGLIGQESQATSANAEPHKFGIQVCPEVGGWGPPRVPKGNRNEGFQL